MWNEGFLGLFLKFKSVLVSHERIKGKDQKIVYAWKWETEILFLHSEKLLFLQ